MRIRVLVLAIALAAATAQRQQVSINAETPEGQMLQQIGQEADEAKKLALMEEFAQKNPKHEAIAWVYEQMIAAYAKASQFDKTMDAADKLLAIDPNDAQSAHAALKAAEASKNQDAVVKWAAKTSETARKVYKGAKPADEDEDDWKARADFARQLDTYAEYSLYAAALQAADPRKRIALAEALEKLNPESQYVPQVVGHQFLAYLQAGDTAKAVVLAEQLVAKDQATEEMLVTVAGQYRSQKKDPDKVLAYCNKVVELTNTRPKPEGVSDADWNKRKTQLAGRANFIAGATLFAQNKWVQADQQLRSALPGVEDDQQMTAEALFYLGVSNYRLGEKGDNARIKDALMFSEKCAAIKSPYQAPARTNVKAIRSQYRAQ